MRGLFSPRLEFELFKKKRLRFTSINLNEAHVQQGGRYHDQFSSP